MVQTLHKFSNFLTVQITPLQSKIEHLFSKNSFFKRFSLKTSTKMHKIYIWTVFLSLMVVSLVAQILFPSGYEFWRNTISEQGSIALNPIGSIFWRIFVILNGLAHIPHILYIEKLLSPLDSHKAKKIRNSGIIAAIGFSLVGLISMDYGISHYIVALIAFIGYYVAANYAFSILSNSNYPTQKTIKELKWFKWFKRYFNISGFLLIISFIFNQVLYGKDLDPTLEWNYFLAICAWLIIWPYIASFLNKH